MSKKTETLDWNKLPALYKALGGKSAGRAVARNPEPRTKAGSVILVCFDATPERPAGRGGIYRRVLALKNGRAVGHFGVRVRSWTLVKE
jgi:hypothetical protein